MHLNILFFAVIGLCSLHISGNQSTVQEQQPYTAEQHLHDVKTLLESIKYKDNEIYFFSFEKKRLNKKIDVVNRVFEEWFNQLPHHLFINSTPVSLYKIIYEKKFLRIPKDKKLFFNSQMLRIIEKTQNENKRLEQEELKKKLNTIKQNYKE